jgi:ABC-type lipoprotein export system ATPase subunit
LIELIDIVHSFETPGGRDVPLLAIPHWAATPRACNLVTGPSGAGKSTLLAMMAGLLKPDAGRVIVEARDVWALDDSERDGLRAQRIGCLVQDAYFLDSLDVLDNVAIVLLLAGRDRRTHRERARALLDRVGLADRASSPPAVLSGGEKVRLSLARALANDPPLVLADEPTASLDRANAEHVAALLDALVRDEGKTLIVATHEPERFDAASRLDLPARVPAGGAP